MVFNQSAMVSDLLYSEIGYFIRELNNSVTKNFTIEIVSLH